MAERYEGTRKTEFKIELLVIFSILISLGFPGNLTEIYGNRLGQVLEYTAIGIEILVMVLSSGKSWLDVQIVNLDKKYVPLYLFVVVIFLESMLVTRYRQLQFISCTRLTVTLLFSIWLQERFSFERMVELICIAQTIFVVSITMFMLRYPKEAFESGLTFIHAFKGLYPTKNSMASQLSFGIIVVAFLIRERRRNRKGYSLWIAVLAVQGVLIGMCQATGAVGSLLIAFIPLMLPDRIRLPLGWAYIGGSLLFLFITLTLMPHFEWFFQAIGKDATLTGRIPLWNQIIAVMMNRRTFTGYGYGMFWRDQSAVALIQAGFYEHSFLGNITTGAHNMLMEFWLNIGLIGIAMFFAALLYSMREIGQISHKKYVFSSMVLAYLMVNGLTERCLGGTYDYKTFSIWLVMALCCNRKDTET